MTIKIKLILALMLIGQTIFAQQNIPIIKATSKKIAIRDGNQGLTKYWSHLSANLKPVVYDISKINSNRKLTFFTDIDSISFDIKPNSKYPFKVILNSKDTCSAEISTIIPTYYKDCNGCVITSDTIPFILGDDHYIHIKGKVNNSEILDLIFDTGAGSCLLNENGQKKAKMKLDGVSDGEGTSGATQNDMYSSANFLQIASLNWKNLPIGYIDYKGSINTDGVIGYNIFEDKIVEINYDKSIMIIHSKLPQDITDYKSANLRHDLNGTFIEATLTNKKKNYKGWFLFDTGGSLTLLVSGSYSSENSLFGSMESIAKTKGTGNGKGFFEEEIVTLPNFNLLGFNIPNLPIHLAASDKSFYGEAGIIGNNILKRFNTIIDYPNATVYLKPNGLMNATFEKKKNNTLVYTISLIGLVLLFLIIVLRVKRKKVNK
ncbi:MAG: retropepsin-like aspartic protease [Flavobacterium sp.]